VRYKGDSSFKKCDSNCHPIMLIINEITILVCKIVYIRKGPSMLKVYNKFVTHEYFPAQE